MSEKSETRGVIYIVRNELFPDYIKIGSTQDIQQRMKELSGTNIPVAYNCLFAGEVKNYKGIEKSFHSLLASERIKNKEFFKYENELSLLKIVDNIKNLIKNHVGFKDVTRDADAVAFTNSTSEQKQYLKKEQESTKRGRTTFKMLGISNGEELVSTIDDNFKCKVVNNTKISFENKEQTLSEAALKILHRKGYKWKSAQGPNFWKYKGKALSVIRNQLEIEDIALASNADKT